MCIRDRRLVALEHGRDVLARRAAGVAELARELDRVLDREPVSYTHLRAHETVLDLVCRLLLAKKKPPRTQKLTEVSHSRLIC